MDEASLAGFLQSHPKLQQGMFGAKRSSFNLFTPLSKASPATIARLIARPSASIPTMAFPATPQERPSPPLPPPYDGMMQGVTARAAPVGILSDRARAIYVDRVGKLAQADSAARNALKAKARAITPKEVRIPLEAYRPNLGPLTGSGGRANVTNASVDRLARVFGKLSRGAGVVGTIVALDDILTSPDRARALTANIGAGLGGFFGGAGGAAAGAVTGPAAPVLAPAGGLAGSIAGGRLGYKAGEDVYDFLANW